MKNRLSDEQETTKPTYQFMSLDWYNWWVVLHK